jgi:hypothetical protein
VTNCHDPDSTMANRHKFRNPPTWCSIYCSQNKIKIHRYLWEVREQTPLRSQLSGCVFFNGKLSNVRNWVWAMKEQWKSYQRKSTAKCDETLWGNKRAILQTRQILSFFYQQNGIPKQEELTKWKKKRTRLKGNGSQEKDRGRWKVEEDVQCFLSFQLFIRASCRDWRQQLQHARWLLDVRRPVLEDYYECGYAWTNGRSAWISWKWLIKLTS